MALTISNLGQNNIVHIPVDVIERSVGNITIVGSNSEVSITAGSVLQGGSIHLGSNCRISIERSSLAAAEIHCIAGATITIGENCSFTWRTQILAHEKAEISVGSNCLFATETLVTLSDMHPIYDLHSGERLNDAKSISIGSHVWIGFRAMILKGAVVGEGSVIGAGAIVTGNVPRNCLAAGIPARVVRRDVVWNSDFA